MTGAWFLYSIENSPKSISPRSWSVDQTKLTLALRHPSQVTRVPKHVVQRHLGNQGKLVIPDLRVDDRPLPLVDCANDVPLELDRRDDFDRHDRLQDDRGSLGESLAESAEGGKTESEFVGVVDVGGTVLKDKAAAIDAVAGELSAVESFLESLRYQLMPRRVDAERSSPFR